MRDDYESATNALIGVKTEESNAFLATDKDNIFKAVEASIGFQKLNSMVNDQMRHWFVQQGTRAVQQLEASGTDLSEDTEFATSCGQLGIMLYGFAQHELALEYFAKALHIRQKVRGEDHTDTATTYHNMAVVYSAQGKHELALEYYAKALRIKQKMLGENHPDTANNHTNIAYVYKAQNNLARALEHQVSALRIKQRLYGPQHASTLRTQQRVDDLKKGIARTAAPPALPPRSYKPPRP